MKLVLYGGGDFEDNREINKYLVKLTNKKNPQITYIPSQAYQSEGEFQDFAKEFSKLGVYRLLYFPIDVYFDEIMLKEAFKSDIIFLGGGNTFYFLNNLRKNKMLKMIKEYVKKGGVLSGLSAGGILMSPSITTASFPTFDCDYNEENLTNFKSLNLTKFDFFPHYRNSKRYEFEMINYSKKLKYPLFSVPDGSGIVVNKNEMIFIGKTYQFLAGRKYTMN